MVDTPESFIKAVMDTDDAFIQGLDASTVLSIYFIPNPLGVLDPLVNPLLNNLKDRMHAIFQEAKKIVDNPPECIENDDVYVTKNYVTRSEIPFVLDATRHTAMNRYFHVPDGMNELRHKIAKIPCCHGED